METNFVNETTDTSALVYQVDATGRKNGYFRQSIWNAAPKFRIIYDGKTGMQQILRSPDMIIEYYYKDGVLNGAYTITRQSIEICDEINGDMKPMIRSKIEGNYTDGKKSGFEFEYANSTMRLGAYDCCLVREAHYRNGKLDGHVRRFDMRGKLVYSAAFVGGFKHGTETYYTPDGGITRLDSWVYGRKVVV
ncbi:hypothetical protein F-S17_0485 [Faustovirus]|nr:hypothetical protein F-S17_0485 [Faustovirus]QJX73247.1 hypothetical protein F-VV57_0486 [Faustovirus]QJX73754.1 hypothetical protein F-VV63_0488 [Faustovirus]